MRYLTLLALIGAIAAGCTGSDDGELPPPRKEMTQTEIEAMPPEARAAMENAQRQGEQMERTRGVTGNGGQ